VPASSRASELAQIAAKAALEKLASDVLIIDVSDKFPLSDMFVIASGQNTRQVSAIVDEIEKELLKLKVKSIRKEGTSESQWILLDFSEIIVHVQLAENRELYALERLWKDCPIEVVNG
jgi:ribosome-associated protein